MDTIGRILSWIAALLHALGYVAYGRQVTKKTSTPSLTTWSLLAVLTSLNLLSYFHMSGDIAKSAQAAIGCLMCLRTFRQVLRQHSGAYTVPETHEWIAITCAFVAIPVWWTYKQVGSAYANLFISFAALAAFWPMIHGAYKEPWREQVEAFIVWLAAFLFGGIGVWMRYSGQPLEFAYTLTGLIMNIAMISLCNTWRKRRLARASTA